jgi:MFS family permease
MYISLRDRPGGPSARTGPRRRVAPIVVALGFVSLLTDISSESVSAILPLYLTSVMGLSMVAYGFVDGLYQGISALVRVAAGLASDRTDHPKWVAFLGYGLSCVARVFLLSASGVAAISTVVAADRIGKGIRTAPRDAMIASATDTADLGRAFGVHRALDTAGAALGPLIAFVVLWGNPTGYSTVMVISLAAAVVGVALLALLVPDRRPRRMADQLQESSGGTTVHEDHTRLRWREVADPRLTRLLVVVGMLGLLTVGDGFVYLALLAHSEFATHWLPLLYVGTNVVYLALAVPIGSLADRMGRGRVLVAGHLALVVAYACAALPGGRLAVLGSLLALGTFYAATDGVTAAVAGRLVRPGVRASGIASAQTVVAVARMLSSTVFGALWFLMGPRVALMLVSGLLLAAIVAAAPVMARLDVASDRW